MAFQPAPVRVSVNGGGIASREWWVWFQLVSDALGSQASASQVAANTAAIAALQTSVSGLATSIAAAKITLETNGALNVPQTKLNLVQGANIQLTADRLGNVIIGAYGFASLTANNVWLGQQFFNAAVQCNAAVSLGAGPLNFSTQNASWQEWRFEAIAGGSVSADTFVLQSNSRITVGGADNWAAIFTVQLGGGFTMNTSSTFSNTVQVGGSATFNASATFNGVLVANGAATFSSTVALNGGTTLGASLNLNGQTVSGNATLSGALSFTGACAFSVGASFTAALVGSTAAISAKVAGQAAFDLFNTTTGGTPSTGAHWRLFADNIGGGGGNLTFGFYDVANGRLAFGVDNTGDVAFESVSGGSAFICQIGAGAPLAGTANSLWIQPGAGQFNFNAYNGSAWINTATVTTSSGLWNFPNGVNVTGGKIQHTQWEVQFPYYETAGPLPLSTSITLHGGSVLLMISGSCFAAAAGTVIGFTVAIDGTTSATAKVYANAAATHLSVVAVPFYAAYGHFSSGSHTLALTAISGTSTDANDFFSVSIFEFPW